MRLTIIFFMSFLIFFGCKKASNRTRTADIQETAQQVGDVMASVDESGGSAGTIASSQDTMKKSIQNTFDRYAPNEMNESLIAKLILPDANAVTCSGAGFAACNRSGVVTRSFAGCTVGSAVFSGDVTLTWSNGGTCGLTAAAQSITRVPNFTVTGRRGATLTVTKTGTIGQRITWASGAGASKVFDFKNDGISRVFTIGATTLFNQTTATSGDITVTGTSRTSRVMSGGSLNVTNNLTSVVCNYIPTGVTWAGTTCNCPTSGSWSGTCSNGKSTTLNITGCGTASYTEGADTQAVTFDRCGT